MCMNVIRIYDLVLGSKVYKQIGKINKERWTKGNRPNKQGRLGESNKKVDLTDGLECQCVQGNLLEHFSFLVLQPVLVLAGTELVLL